MSDDEKINLENYNYNNKSQNLNSPFSLKALQYLGIEEKELKTLTLEEYIKLNPDSKDISQELQKQRYMNYVQKHDDLIYNAKKKRKELIAENEKELNSDKNTENNENKIYHCELHQASYSSNFFIPKAKINPNCEKCIEYSKKYEKSKERMILNIQLEIDHEYDKKEKRKKQLDKHKKYETDYPSKREEIDNVENNEKIKNRKERDYERELNYREKKRKGLEVKRNMELLTEQQMTKLRNKQKELELRDEKRKIQLELFKKNNSKSLNEAYALKKSRVNKTLNDYDVKREEKNKKYLATQKLKQERQERFERDLLKKRTQKSQALNRLNSDRLRKAIEIEEELNRKRLESYNKKINNYNQREKSNSITQKQLLKQEQIKQAENLKAINIRRQQREEKIEEEK